MIPRFILDQIIDRALSEDLSGGDLTTEATVPADARGVGRARAKQEVVVCGGQVFERVFYRVDPQLSFEPHFDEGAVAAPGTR